jgi:ubiquinone/menaquinone biosynthesis C-methylase UbiE
MTTYTHGHHESVLRSHRWRTLENSAAHLLPMLRQDQAVLDVGCGPGTITAELAARTASVIAVEINEGALDLARAEIARRGLVNVEFLVSDAHALNLPDDSVDVVHAHQVLQHVADPVQVLREMRRVCRPGGIVAVRDSDYASFAWWPQLPGLDEWMSLYQRAATANGGEPQAGRRLLSWARTAGFTDVRASSSTWCFATPEDRDYWGGMWADRILHSAMAEQIVRERIGTKEDLQSISDDWARWTASDDGWFSVLHAELVCRA